jgi:hypothetical protein
MSLCYLTIGFDADDTLWHNEVYFERVHERYRELLVHYHDAATVNRTLFATELRNLPLYGYGAKGFTLSAIETAVELTQGKISAEEIRQLIVLGQEMLAQPVELLDGVAETLAELAGAYRLLVITKGDLHHQERKLAGSGLAAHEGRLQPTAALLCLGFAALVQVGTNYVNDYADHRRGADTAERVGPRRAVAAGLISPGAMRRAGTGAGPRPASLTIARNPSRCGRSARRIQSARAYPRPAPR